MGEVVRREGYRYSSAVMNEVVARTGARVSEAAILREARGVDDGDRYLDRRELSAGAAIAARKLAHPPKTEVREGFFAMSSATAAQHQVMKTALRQVLEDHGAPAKAPDASRFKAFGYFSDGPAGRDNLMSIVVPVGIDGKPNLSGGPDGRTPFYYRRDDFGMAPKFFGPFSMNGGGFVEEMKLTRGDAISMGAVKKAFETVLYKSAGTDGNEFFGPVDVGGARSDSAMQRLVVKPLLGEISRSERRSVSLLAEGPGAAQRYLDEEHSASDGRASLKFVLDELKASGHVSGAFAYKVSHESRGVGMSMSTLVRESTMLVIVDDRGRAFGFKEGTY